MPIDTPDSSVRPVTIGASKPMLPMALGGSWYVPYSAPGDADAEFLAAMETAYDAGVRHFDTGAGYGGGHSEELYGRFAADKRDEIFLASKANISELTAGAMLGAVEASLRRLGTDRIELYYIHWPRSGRDMRPVMEGLERAKAQGKIGAAGVSNFTVSQMRQVMEVGPLAALQLGYNLTWRYPEDEVIPFCIANGIAVVAYSALAHGILTGKFGRDPGLRQGDQRHTILPFRADIWPHVYEGVERLKEVAADANRPLMHLAIRWLLSRPGVSSVVVGARNREQAVANFGALEGSIPPGFMARMTQISDEIARHVPDAGNLFDYYP
jgi:myo-inositol catabolism protein IolS